MDKIDNNKKLIHLFESLNQVKLSEENFPIDQRPVLFDENNVEQFIERLKTELVLPNSNISIKGNYSTLGGVSRMSILLLIMFDLRDQWAHGILENSHYARFHISKDGIIELFSSGDVKNRFRKTRVKSQDDAIKKLIMWEQLENNS
jgi:hypothetical protein